jgi:hypothetical protein
VVTSDAGWGFYSATNQVPGTGMETGWVLIQADPPPAPAEAGFGSFSLISVQP